MGGIKKVFGKLLGKKNRATRPGEVDPGLGSHAVTGITTGDAGSNTGGGTRGNNRRPGRRGTDTPLGPGRRRM